MAQHELAWWPGRLGLMVLLLALALSGCKNTASESTDKDATPAVEAPQAEAPTAEPGAAGEAELVDPADDLYPQFQFGILEADEQRTFIEIAKAELCPCPDAAESLHQCMQKAPGARCRLAELVAAEVGRQIKEGKNQTDILDHVAAFVENYKKVQEFDLDQTPRLGPADAEVVVVEFADFQCPHCAEFSEIVHDAHEALGDDVAFYFKQFPLGGHQYGALAARAALAAQKQGKFWPMHDLLFHNQQALSPEKIEYLGQQLGLNMQKFKKDLESPEIAAQVQADKAEGEAANITGTPTIFVNGRRYLGPRTLDAFVEALRAETTQADGADAAP